MTGQLVAELAERVVLPLLAGGALRPLAPIGHERALEVAQHAAFASSVLDEARARRVRLLRRLCALDVFADPTPGEWLMVCALNDLLQATNPTLLGPFGGDRPHKLLEMAGATLSVAGAPAHIGEALSRHATFSRLLEVVRIDTHVSFWVGRRVYKGMKPPRRITRWRNVRRVSEREEPVRLPEMAPANPAATPEFEGVFGSLLALSPLTDLANAGRDLPEFSWSGAALSLVKTRAGRTLALRVIERGSSPKRALTALGKIPEPIRRGVTPDAAEAATSIADLISELGRRKQAGRPSDRAPG